MTAGLAIISSAQTSALFGSEVYRMATENFRTAPAATLDGQNFHV